MGRLDSWCWDGDHLYWRYGDNEEMRPQHITLMTTETKAWSTRISQSIYCQITVRPHNVWVKAPDWTARSTHTIYVARRTWPNFMLSPRCYNFKMAHIITSPCRWLVNGFKGYSTCYSRPATLAPWTETFWEDDSRSASQEISAYMVPQGLVPWSQASTTGL